MTVTPKGLRPVHAGKLERWLGTEKIAHLQACMGAEVLRAIAARQRSAEHELSRLQELCEQL